MGVLQYGIVTGNDNQPAKYGPTTGETSNYDPFVFNIEFDTDGSEELNTYHIIVNEDDQWTTFYYYFLVDWGDGELETWDGNKTQNFSHTYASGSTEYELKLYGVITNPSFYEDQNIKYVSDFGDLTIQGCAYMFFNCSRLSGVTTDTNDSFKNCTNLQRMFAFCNNLVYVGDGIFDSCRDLTDASYVFEECISLTSIPSDIFNTTNNPAITHLEYTFYNCTSITGALPELWNDFNSVDSTECFRGCTNASNYLDVPYDWGGYTTDYTPTGLYKTSQTTDTTLAIQWVTNCQREYCGGTQSIYVDEELYAESLSGDTYQYTITDRTADTSYDVYIKYISTGSTEYDGTPVSMVTDPPNLAPTNITQGTTTETTMVISWTASCSPDECGGTYSITVDEVEVVSELSGGTTAYQLTELTSDTEYIIQVFYIATDETLYPSDSESFSTSATAYYTPTNLAEVSKTSSTISVDWTNNCDDDSSCSGDMNVYLDDVEYEGSISVTTGYTYTGLTASTEYDIKIGYVASDTTEYTTSNIQITTNADTPTGSTEPIMYFKFDGDLTDEKSEGSLSEEQGEAAYDDGLNEESALKFDDTLGESCLILRENTFDWNDFVNGEDTYNGNMSVSFWIKPDLTNQLDVNGYWFVINNNNSFDSIGYDLDKSSNGGDDLCRIGIGGDGTYLVGAEKTSDTWYNIGFSVEVDSDDNSAELKFYIDGQFYTGGTATNYVPETTLQNWELTMGSRRYDNTATYPKGLLQYVRIYDVVLSDSDFEDIYDNVE